MNDLLTLKNAEWGRDGEEGSVMVMVECRRGDCGGDGMGAEMRGCGDDRWTRGDNGCRDGEAAAKRRGMSGGGGGCLVGGCDSWYWCWWWW